MQNLWMLSSFTTDSNGSPYPACSAYASAWQAPMWPAFGSNALVYCTCTDNQIAAAQTDPDVVVCATDLHQPIPLAVTQAYVSQGAIIGESLAALLIRLGKIEPNFLRDPILSIRPTAEYFSTLPATTTIGQSDFEIGAQGIGIRLITIPVGVTFSNITVGVSDADSNLHSFGFYDTEGELITATAPQNIPASGCMAIPTTTLQAGSYYFAWTCGAISTVQLCAATMILPAWAAPPVSARSDVSAVLPATIDVPSRNNAGPINVTVIAFQLW